MTSAPSAATMTPVLGLPTTLASPTEAFGRSRQRTSPKTCSSAKLLLVARGQEWQCDGAVWPRP